MNPIPVLDNPTLAVRENSISLLEEGLIELSECQTNFEVTDYLGVISLYYDAAIILGAKPDDFFLSLSSKLESLKFVDILNNFLSRPADEKTIRAWGYDKIHDPVFTYIQKC